MLREASHSWSRFWICPREKATIVASIQLADEECARMCIRGHKDVWQKRGQGGRKVVHRYDTVLKKADTGW